jgi:hypothetical protein
MKDICHKIFSCHILAKSFKFNNKINLVNRFSVLFLLFFLSFIALSQTTISVCDFETTPATPTMSYTNTNGGTFTGASGTGDRPASSNFFTSSNTGFGVSNNTSTLTFSNITNLECFASKFFEFRLASFSISSTGNGADGADSVYVDVSLDGGTTWSREVTVNGNSNAYWSYGASGIASVTYDGNNVSTKFTPSGGGSRTTDGYSTVRVLLPNTCSQARIRINLLNNTTNERWVIDDVKLIGTAANAIITGTLSAASYSVSCATGTNGSVNFTSCGTYDAENAYKVELSDAAGSFANAITIGSLTSTATSGTINFTIPEGMQTSSNYLIRIVSTSPAVTGSTSSSFTINLTDGPCNTITTGSTNASSYSVSCTSGASASVTYTSTGTFLAGNVFTVQLSDASGNFGSPLNVGSLTSTSNSGSISFGISSGLSGTSYKVRVVSSNPETIGTESAAFTITLSDGPCGPLFLETFNEVANSTSGTDDVGGVAWTAACPTCLDANDYNKVENGKLRIRDSNGPATLTTGSINISSCTDSYYIKMDITAIGGMEACANTPAENNIDWVAMEYKVNGGAWQGVPGHYNCGATDAFNSTVAIYDVDGEGSTTYNSGCLAPANTLELRITAQNWAGAEYWEIDNLEVGCISCVNLPITLSHFYANCEEDEILFNWATASESNNALFTIEKTSDGTNFSEIYSTAGAGNSFVSKEYSYRYQDFVRKDTYFRLKQTDFNGEYTYSSLISTSCSLDGKIKIFPNPSTNQFIITGYDLNSKLLLHDSQGKLIKIMETDKFSTEIKLDNFASGVYYLTIQGTFNNFVEKLILQK